MTVDGAGNIYVADQGNSRVEEFSAAGKVKRTFGDFFSTQQPQAVAVDRHGTVYMLDAGGIRLYRANGKQVVYWR